MDRNWKDLLTEVPPGFGGGRLKALPAARLLANERFREAIGYRTAVDRSAPLIDVLEPVRRRFPKAIGALECAIEDAPGRPWRNRIGPLSHWLRR